MSTYACQWGGACVRYDQLSGDRSLLEELFSAAVGNFAALEAHVNADGLSDDVGWAFVDWGYARPDAPIEWGHAETLAFATLVSSRVPVRLTGTRPGTICGVIWIAPKAAP